MRGVNKIVDKTEKVVVVGCSGCGAFAALTSKKLKPSLDVTIIREPEERGLLTRCATPYICCGDVMVDPSYKDDRMFTDRGISLVNVRAVEIKRESRVVVTADGGEYPYDTLVLATGARAVVPPVTGINLPGVFTLRTSGDATSILHWINSRRITTAVLIGAGAIGVEDAYLLSRQGLNVTVVDTMAHVMPTALDADMSALVEKYMQDKGLALRLNCRVSAIEGAGGVESVTLDSGEKIDAGIVIVAAGTRCNVELAEKAGLELGLFGLKVNEYLQTSAPDIYAGGDLIEYQSHITGKPTLGQLRPNAVIAGRVIGKNIAGYGITFPPLINGFCTKFFDKSIAATGITESEAEKEGIPVVATKETSASRHSMIRGQQPYTLKLIFARESQKVIGCQIVSDSECPVRDINVISLAIRCGLKAADLATFRAAGQPELSADPGREPIALTADTAFYLMNGAQTASK
ncbi:MAG: FAD-dependent oxidoreductase [Armatimonadota bacterium]